MSWVHVLWSCPSALLFHTIAQHIFNNMLQANPPESACVDAMKRHDFTVVPASHFHLSDDEGTLFCAAWWSGIARLQPGSALGSQAQESRHLAQRQMISLHVQDSSSLLSFRLCFVSLKAVSASSNLQRPSHIFR